MVGAPLAAGLLAMDGFLGLDGWQWLFLAEVCPVSHTFVFSVLRTSTCHVLIFHQAVEDGSSAVFLSISM